MTVSWLGLAAAFGDDGADGDVEGPGVPVELVVVGEELALPVAGTVGLVLPPDGPGEGLGLSVVVVVVAGDGLALSVEGVVGLGLLAAGAVEDVVGELGLSVVVVVGKEGLALLVTGAAGLLPAAGGLVGAGEELGLTAARAGLALLAVG
jgi:hypothetical protein